jgi:hypothetical protein
MPTRSEGVDQHDVPATNGGCPPKLSDKEYHMDTIAIINLAVILLLVVLLGLFVLTPDEFGGNSADDTMPQVLGQRPQ